MKRIHDSLQHVFGRSRLVFWYDPECQWTKAFDGFEREGIKKIKKVRHIFLMHPFHLAQLAAFCKRHSVHLKMFFVPTYQAGHNLTTALAASGLGQRPAII